MSIENKIFQECVFICDQSSWVWNTTSHFLESNNIPFIHMSSNTSIRKSWSRISDSPKILIHWEAKHRHGGAIVEEIFAVYPKFDIEDKLIAICSDPSAEDQVYLSELNVTNVVTLRNNQFDIRKALLDLKGYFFDESSVESKHHKVWRKLILSLEKLSPTAPEEVIQKIEGYLHRVGAIDNHNSDRYFFALGLYYLKMKREDSALKNFELALEQNANYTQAREAIVKLYISQGKYKKALDILKLMQARNKNNVSRLVLMGNIHSSMKDEGKAEHYFHSALNKDQYCGGALNGLASLRFSQGKLEESRRLLSQSAIAYQIAAKLNSEGISMVKDGLFEQALDHYKQAHYVLPNQDKGPMLFYNIGLCYSRWGKKEPAKQFLQLALIKEPNYKKAEKLLLKLNKA